MTKTVLITGSTDEIGLETAKMLVLKGHHVLLHGRNSEKLAQVEKVLSELGHAGQIESYIADLSSIKDVESLAKSVADKHSRLDVLINNAGVLKTPNPITPDGLDVRFVVNTIAPYRLTQLLLPLFDTTGRIINISSAAQASVNLKALAGHMKLSDMEAYSQSKLAIIMWSREMANSLGAAGPVIVAVNPGSLLASKMVKEGFGVVGKDIGIGADILCRAALCEEFENVSGEYFDNDVGELASPHSDAINLQKSKALVRAIDSILAEMMR